MNPHPDPRQRLLKCIADAYASKGGHLVDETLVLPDKELSLHGLPRFVERLATSREFTRLPPLLGADLGLPMASMYVELAVSRSQPVPAPTLLGSHPSLASALDERHRRQQVQRLSVDDALGSGRDSHVVILGDPGGGKTSLLKRATALIAGGQWPGWTVPLYIPLRRYWETRRRYPDAGMSLLHFAAFRIVEMAHVDPSIEYVSTVAVYPGATPQRRAEVEEVASLLSHISTPARNHVLFLLDGLDEVASDPDAVRILGEEIRLLSHGFSWVLTSRRAGFFGDLEEDIRYEVTRLDNGGIEQLVRNWFDHMAPAAESAHRAENVLSQIMRNPRLLSMARNPFLLTLLCHIQWQDAGDLPIQRSAVYERFFKLAREQLQSREKDPSRFSAGDLEYLAAFCRHLYTDARGAPRHLFDRDDWDRYAQGKSAPDLDRQFLASRLLDQWGDARDYHLVHLTLHEYLVARDLAESGAPVKAALARLHQPHWRMVLRFLAGLYVERGRTQDLGILIKAMLDPVDLNGLMYIEAAQLLLEAGIEDSSALLGYDLRTTLWQLWKDNTPFVGDAAGLALAALAPSMLLDHAQQLIDAIGGEIDLARLNTAAGVPGRQALRAVLLLGELPTDEAVSRLLDLLLDNRRPQLADNVVHALVSRNWPGARRAVVAVADGVSNDDPAFIRICHLIGFSPHRDYAPWLLERLAASELPANDLLVACAMVGGTNLDQALLDRIVRHPEWSNGWPPDTWDNLATRSAAWREWIVQTAQSEAVPGEMTQVAVRNRLFDEPKLFSLLSSADEPTLAALVQAVGDSVLANHPVSHGLEQQLAQYLVAPVEAREAAVFALSQLDERRQAGGGRRRYDADFLRLIDDPDDRVRELAIAALGNTRDSAMRKPLLDVAVREGLPVAIHTCAIEALGHLPRDTTGTVATLLEKLLAATDVHEDAVLEAALALARTDTARLGKHLSSPTVREALAQVGAELGMVFFDDFYVDASGERCAWAGIDASIAMTKATAEVRIDAIDELERIIDDTKDERELQALLAAEPWLIDPSGELLTANQSLKHFEGRFLRFLGANDKAVRGRMSHGNKRPDFTFCRIESKLLLVVEIKKSGHRFDDADMERLSNYAVAFDRFFVENPETVSALSQGWRIELIADGVDMVNSSNLIGYNGLVKDGKLKQVTWSDFLHRTKITHEELLDRHAAKPPALPPEP